MRHPIKTGPLFRLVTLLLLAVTLSGCSPSVNRGGNWFNSRPEDLSKIYVDFVASGTSALPANATMMLTGAIRRQLQEENSLQMDSSVHSLRLKSIIFSYQNATLIVQAELFDDDKFLVYSQFERHIAPNDDWVMAMDIVAEQLLDELINKLRMLEGTPNN